MHVAGVKSKLDLRLAIEFHSNKYYADIKEAGFRKNCQVFCLAGQTG